jgi:hypothetical protein
MGLFVLLTCYSISMKSLQHQFHHHMREHSRNLGSTIPALSLQYIHALSATSYELLLVAHHPKTVGEPRNSGIAR